MTLVAQEQGPVGLFWYLPLKEVVPEYLPFVSWDRSIQAELPILDQVGNQSSKLEMRSPFSQLPSLLYLYIDSYFLPCDSVI